MFACKSTDPERIVRGGPTLTTFFSVFVCILQLMRGGEDANTKRHLNWFGSVVIFEGILASIAKESYSVVIFQGGGGGGGGVRTSDPHS